MANIPVSKQRSHSSMPRKTPSAAYLVRPDKSYDSGFYPLIHDNARMQQDFVNPIWLGQPLSRELISLTPNPYKFEVTPANAQFPDWFGGDAGMLWYVSKAIKGLIEQLEPGAHNFIPINASREAAPGEVTQLFILHITSAVQAIVIDKTAFADGVGRNAYDRAPQINPLGPIVLDRALISGRHFWRGALGQMGPLSSPFSHTYCCSEVFRQLVMSAGQCRLEFYPCEVQPVGWVSAATEASD